ncbi:helix-turn-helix transcriptional regulator [Mucilaginibacter pedocola]|uniref:AraC family transcriptional regulator n=1 Tax=Mucilaginibacter pedocola TaxID=1792845 RepID=A0A1S9PKP0_9SPHI|nr:AraC family transcriptional regulator [Mucilaginibacter pedocola]OOQ61505.1 AraC family transcriptional regulator [Mucilaginibacter pedocola]
MTFSFTATPEFDYMAYFARHIGVEVNGHELVVPGSLGKGHIRKFLFDADFKITMHSYLLNEDLVVNRTASGQGNELITIFFYSNEHPLGITYNNDPGIHFSQRDESAIQVTSNDLSSTIRFPADQQIHYVVVAIKPARLAQLLKITAPNSVIRAITGKGNSFLFFEEMNAETKLLLKNLSEVNFYEPLANFLMQIKVQELLYLLFRKLSARESTVHQAINSADAGRLLYIRNAILSDLSVPPVLPELARMAAMSETKLKQLFKQTFGETIYNYYQQARMEEAAFLLRQGRHSVAEVGYEMGFTNLSHFSRLFERHYGLNPKKYSLT